MQKLNINDTKRPFLLLKICYIIFKNMKMYGIYENKFTKFISKKMYLIKLLLIISIQ